MNASEIKKRLTSTPFEPFVIVMSSGDRYEIRHPEFAFPVSRGQLYLFRPRDDEDREFQRPIIIALMHVAAIEPAPEHAA